MTSTDPRPLPVPPEAHAPLWDLDRTLYGRGAEAAAVAEAVARPVVVAELLAFADRVAALTGNGSPVYRDGYNAAINEVRELIADRCDELGVKVENL